MSSLLNLESHRETQRIAGRASLRCVFCLQVRPEDRASTEDGAWWAFTVLSGYAVCRWHFDRAVDDLDWWTVEETEERARAILTGALTVTEEAPPRRRRSPSGR